MPPSLADDLIDWSLESMEEIESLRPSRAALNLFHRRILDSSGGGNDHDTQRKKKKTVFSSSSWIFREGDGYAKLLPWYLNSGLDF